MASRRGAATIEVEPGLYGRRLVDGKHGARRVSLVEGWMRPGGRHSPHTHDVEEAVVFLAGRGIVDIAGRRVDVGPGDTLNIPAHTVHSTFNPGEEDLRFVAAFADCLITGDPLDTAAAPRPGPRTLRRRAAAFLTWVARRLTGQPGGVTTPS